MTYFNKTSSKSVQESDEVTVDFQNSHVPKIAGPDYSKYDNDTNNLHFDINKNMKQKQNYQLNNKLKPKNLTDGRNWILKEDMVKDEIPHSTTENPMFEKNENENEMKDEKKSGNKNEHENENEKFKDEEQSDDKEIKNKEESKEVNKEEIKERVKE